MSRSRSEFIRHPLTGDVLLCKICGKPAVAFLGGLWPLCEKHGQEAVALGKQFMRDKDKDKISEIEGIAMIYKVLAALASKQPPINP